MLKQILPGKEQIMSCAICAGDTISAIERERIPALQNRVYSSAREARAAQYGRLEIRVCRRCGYAFNAAFDSTVVVYDEHYNNDVPSRTFDQYYQKIATHLRQRYLQNGGTVLDVGCGKGQFLQTLTRMFGDIRGIGIDPSCRPYEGDRVKLIAAEFPQFMPAEIPDLVICRHTLEHIPNPIKFVRAISAAVPSGTPIFFEVPDASWIVQNRAFWDWCYEHVNYFVAESAMRALTMANVGRPTSTLAFGGQYLWMEGIAGEVAPKTPSRYSPFAHAMLNYARHEDEYAASIRRQILEWRVAGYSIAVWGMATKGIEFVAMVDPEAKLIDHCVDINPLKQEKYTPLSARVIRSPVVLQQSRLPLIVIVMNPCYLNEIHEECGRMSLNAKCITMGFENNVKAAAA